MLKPEKLVLYKNRLDADPMKLGAPDWPPITAPSVLAWKLKSSSELEGIEVEMN